MPGFAIVRVNNEVNEVDSEAKCSFTSLTSLFLI